MEPTKPTFNGVNLQDPIAKTVGRRQAPMQGLNSKTSSKKVARAWQEAFPTPSVPRGVYRFCTHEEADQWMRKVITRSPKT
jgi:hypothetical protein